MLPKIEDVRRKFRNPPIGEVSNWFQKPCTVWAELSVPVVAVVQGFCIGAGLQLALGADFRFGDPTTRMSIMESRWGLIPDMGITQTLPKLMRADQAKKFMMTAEMITAENALRAGLLTETCDDPMTRAQEFLVGVSLKSPNAIAGCKSLVEKTWGMPAGDRLRIEAEIQAELIGSPNQMEAVMAGMAKRKPKFT